MPSNFFDSIYQECHDEDPFPLQRKIHSTASRMQLSGLVFSFCCGFAVVISREAEAKSKSIHSRLFRMSETRINSLPGGMMELADHPIYIERSRRMSEKERHGVIVYSDYEKMHARFRKPQAKPHSRNRFGNNYYYNHDLTPKDCGCPDCNTVGPRPVCANVPLDGVPRWSLTGFGRTLNLRGEDNLAKFLESYKALQPMEELIREFIQRERGIQKGVKAFLTRAHWYRQNYGINILDVYLRQKKQGNYCFNPHCKTKISIPLKIDSVVHHCHICGKLQGIACSSCNFADGFFIGNRDLIASAIDGFERTMIGEEGCWGLCVYHPSIRPNKRKWNISLSSPDSYCAADSYCADFNLFHRYELTRDDLKDRLQKQNGKCLGCSLNISVDARFIGYPNAACIHEIHGDGNGRAILSGLFCGNCNSGFGKVNDDIYLLKGLLRMSEGDGRGGIWGFRIRKGSLRDFHFTRDGQPLVKYAIDDSEVTENNDYPMQIYVNPDERSSLNSTYETNLICYAWGREDDDKEEAQEAQDHPLAQDQDQDSDGECDANNWVCCDSCNHWRKLPISFDRSTISGKWYCSMNTWNVDLNCSSVEELDDEYIPDKIIPPNPAYIHPTAAERAQNPLELLAEASRLVIPTESHAALADVHSVKAGSAAWLAGLREGDSILAVSVGNDNDLLDNDLHDQSSKKMILNAIGSAFLKDVPLQFRIQGNQNDWIQVDVNNARSIYDIGCEFSFH